MGKLSDDRRQELERLYRERGRELWARLYAVCLDADLAMEALHEAIARYGEAGQNGALKNPAAWIYRTACNWLADEHRGVQRRRPLDGKPVVDPATEAIRTELHQAVRDALRTLDQGDRELLVLRYALGWPSKRIAEALETTPTAVDMRLSRARRRLGEVLRARGILDAGSE